jgi:hypothetical protein
LFFQWKQKETRSANEGKMREIFFLFSIGFRARKQEQEQGEEEIQGQASAAWFQAMSKGAMHCLLVGGLTLGSTEPKGTAKPHCGPKLGQPLLPT